MDLVAVNNKQKQCYLFFMEDAIRLLEREATRLYADGSDVAKKLAYSYRLAAEVLKQQPKNN